MVKLASALALALSLFLLPVKGTVYADEPTSSCGDPALEEHLVTDQLAKEPERPRIIVTGWNLDVFKWNMKWAFDIDVDADTVYIIQAKTSGSHEMHVHLFMVRNHCITAYKLTWAKVIAEMLRYDAWEIEHPAEAYADPATIPPVPPGRPAPPVYKPAQ